MCEKTTEQVQSQKTAAVREILKDVKSGTVTFILGVVVAWFFLKAMPTVQHEKLAAPEAASSLQADVTALKTQVVELTKFRDAAASAIMQVGGKLDAVSDNHNKLVEAVQRVTGQTGYDVSLISRSLRNYVGKDKWEKYIKTSDEEFKAEVEKAKADAEKAAKEAADKAKVEPVKAPEAKK